VTPVRVVVGGGVLALLVALAVVLTGSAPRRSGSNYVPADVFVTPISPGQAICQEGEEVPADTGSLRMTLGSYFRPGPALRVQGRRADGTLVMSGGLPAGWREGIVSIPVRRVNRQVQGVQLCVIDAGSGRIAVGGDVPYLGEQVRVVSAAAATRGAAASAPGRSIGARMRVDYLRPGSESWLSLASTISHRFSLAKGGVIRHWAFAGAIALMLIAAVVTVRALLSAERAR
jgi:hypothetical protein